MHSHMNVKFVYFTCSAQCSTGKLYHVGCFFHGGWNIWACGGRHRLAHPLSQDIASPTHCSHINTATELRVNRQLKSWSACVDDASAGQQQASGRLQSDLRTRRSSVACTYNCACAGVLCVRNSILIPPQARYSRGQPRFCLLQLQFSGSAIA